MKNNNPKAILFILVGMLVFSAQDTIMKHIFSFVSLYEVYLIRTLVSDHTHLSKFYFNDQINKKGVLNNFQYQNTYL